MVACGLDLALRIATSPSGLDLVPLDRDQAVQKAQTLRQEERLHQGHSHRQGRTWLAADRAVVSGRRAYLVAGVDCVHASRFFVRVKSGRLGRDQDCQLWAASTDLTCRFVVVVAERLVFGVDRVARQAVVCLDATVCFPLRPSYWPPCLLQIGLIVVKFIRRISIRCKWIYA